MKWSISSGRRAPWLVLGIVACVALAAVSGLLAYGLMSSLSEYRSPLHSRPPQPGSPLGDALTRRVVFVLVDGLRLDTSLDPHVMPFLAELRARGATAAMHSRTPSYSQSAYAVLATGAWPELSDGPALNHYYPDIPTLTQDNLFSAAHRAGLTMAVSGSDWWGKIVPQDSATLGYYLAASDAAADVQLVDTALPWLRSGEAQFVLVHLNQVDTAGHDQGGPRDPRWNAAARRVDGLLREIAGILDLSRDTLFVCSDHGHIDQGGHGGPEAAVVEEPFVLVGAGIRPGSYGDVQQVDVAPTLAALLGTNIPATSQGQVLMQMLSLTPGHEGSIKTAVATQQTQLLGAYEVAIGLRPMPQRLSIASAADPVSTAQLLLDEAHAVRVRAERGWRIALAVGLVAVMAALLVGQRGRTLGWLLVGALAYLSAFNLLYAAVGQMYYSLSSFASETAAIIGTVLRVVVSLIVAWGVVLLALRQARSSPRRSAELAIGLTLVVLCLLALPILVHYVVNGAFVTWTLPEASTMFIGLLSLMQAVFVALLGPLLAGLSALGVWLVRRRLA